MDKLPANLDDFHEAICPVSIGDGGCECFVSAVKKLHAEIDRLRGWLTWMDKNGVYTQDPSLVIIKLLVFRKALDGSPVPE